jgi:hypothetical protein
MHLAAAAHTRDMYVSYRIERYGLRARDGVARVVPA